MRKSDSAAAVWSMGSVCEARCKICRFLRHLDLSFGIGVLLRSYLLVLLTHVYAVYIFTVKRIFYHILTDRLSNLLETVDQYSCESETWQI